MTATLEFLFTCQLFYSKKSSSHHQINQTKMKAEQVEESYRKVKRQLKSINGQSEEYWRLQKQGVSYIKLGAIEKTMKGMLQEVEQLKRSFEFTVNMLDQKSGVWKEKVAKVNNLYNESRRLYFLVEDHLKTDVLHQDRIGGLDTSSDIRGRLVNGVVEVHRQGKQLEELKRAGFEAGQLMQGANQKLRDDRDLTAKLLGHNERLERDIDSADDVIGQIERSVLIKICLMYITIFLLGITILLALFLKLFY